MTALDIGAGQEVAFLLGSQVGQMLAGRSRHARYVHARLALVIIAEPPARKLSSYCGAAKKSIFPSVFPVLRAAMQGASWFDLSRAACRCR